MGGLGLLCKEHRMYAARINFISGDCKKESGKEHAVVLKTVLDGVNGTGKETGIRVVSIASDGEARRGAALVQLTFKSQLSSTSPIYPAILPLRFMDLHVGDDDLTCDKDWKHLIKRFRNLLLRDRGVLIQNTKITPATIKEHLRATDKSKEHIHSVTNPEDLQDVKLAFDLLHDIWSLPHATAEESARPGVQEAREALRILGRLLFHLVYAYLCVNISLSNQLAHLAAAAHLLLVLYRNGGKDFIPTLLYVDLMIMIKNAMYCVAKAKKDTPGADFFLILLGTDRLEIHFGILRTVVGNDANVDILQIAERTGGLLEIADILAKRPNWDRGPRRMQLPALIDGSEDVPPSADHLSPKHLRGDYNVDHVTLLTCWRRGRAMAEEDFGPAVGVLEQAERDQSISILAPHGTLLVNIPLDTDDIDESSEALGLLGPLTMGDDTLPQIQSETLVDIENEIMANDNRTLNDDTHAEKGNISPTVVVNGKETSKSKLLAQMSRYRNTTSSTDRLKRVQEQERYTSTQKGAEYDFDSSLLLIHDPVATLVSCDTRLWLAIGEVNGIRYDGKAIDRIGHSILKESAARVSLQLVGLRPISEAERDELNGGEEWRTYRYTGRTFDVLGKCVEPLDPKVATKAGNAFYLFTSAFLITTTALLVNQMTPATLRTLPKVSPTTEYPYSTSNGKQTSTSVASRHFSLTISSGKRSFLAIQDTGTLDREEQPNQSLCSACIPSVTLDLADGQRVLEHIGAHILFDSSVNEEDEPCGLCLRPSSLCRYVVVKGRGAKASLRVDVERSSGCTRPVNYQYARAAVSVTSAPCSNVPLPCPLCPRSEPAVWRYNLKHHLINTHSSTAAASYTSLWEIQDDELDAMKHVWTTRHAKAAKKTRKSKKSKKLTLLVSREHMSTALDNAR